MVANLFQKEFLIEIKELGIDFIHFVDISQLTKEQNKGYSIAILIGIILSKEYLRAVASTPDYVEQIKINKTINEDEFNLTEIKTDRIADHIENYL